ncbi:YbjN domain-containing protein [Coleofasciculus chthonoplastes]|uniref:YbjN domain-containing protein n=1 Tax=Coleofasciculus chthonoplastes TaxID=64178 RepID=UPI0032F7CE45
MGSLFDVAVQFFEDDDWNFMEVSPGAVLKMAVSGDSGDFDCYAIANEESQIFEFISKAPVKVPEDKRLLIAEFLTRANCGLRIGKFEMDFEDGEIRYQTGIDVEGDRLTPTLIDNLVHVNIFMIDAYLPAIFKVIYGGLSPEKALKEIEENE